MQINKLLGALLLMFCSVFFCNVLFAQETKQISGKVYDAKDSTVIAGAVVMIKGTKIGTGTNSKGAFTLSVPVSATSLTISSVGYSGTEASIRDGEISVYLTSTSEELGEVVIVGYGVTRKKDLTGSVSTVNKKAIENIPILRVDQMLQGQAAGVQVTSDSGAPGSGSSIRIRGGNSINAGNEPLYVIDGLVGGGNLNLVNPQDIASITVLKDASATAIYGARGANGVVLVTTKQGVQGRDNITLDAYYGVQRVPRLIPVLNATEYAKLVNEQAVDAGQPASFANPESLGEGTNWQKEVTQVAPMQSYTLGASGGAKGFNYFISGNYTNQEGIIKNSGFDRYQFRTNLNKQVKDNLKVGIVLNLGRSLTRNNTVRLGGLNSGTSAMSYAPTSPVYNADGSFSSSQPNNPMLFDNPVLLTQLPVNNTTSTNLIGNTFAEWEFVKGLTLKSTFGSELSFVKNASYSPSIMPSRVSSGLAGAASVEDLSSMMWLNENTLSYVKNFGDHSINAVLGTTFQNFKNDQLISSGDKYYADALLYNNLVATEQSRYVIGSNAKESSIFSLLARANYGYKDKYLVTLSGRQDASSRFAENHKKALFGAVALAWNAHNEDFIKDLGIFDTFKLRVSYGTNGNQGIDTYQSLAALRTIGAAGYVIGGVPVLGYTSDRLANPDLRWETTRQIDAGLEVGFLKGRLNVELDYYDKVTRDLLLSKQLPTQTGFTSVLYNAGSIGNKGLELTVKSTNIQKPDFTWSTDFNISGNRNKTINLGGVSDFETYSTGFGNYSVVSKLVVGQPVGVFWGATYMGPQKSTEVPAGSVNPNANQKLGDPLYKDLDGDGKFTTGDWGVIGNSNPKFFGGVGNTFTYKDLSLNVFFQGSYGNQVMNVADVFYNAGGISTNQYVPNQYAWWANRYSATNTETNIPKVNSQNYVYSSFMVYDGSFLRLKTATLSYNLSGKALGLKWINRMNVYVSGTNLWLLTKYPFYDPEVNSFGSGSTGTNSTLRGFDSIDYPQNRTYVLGVNITL